MVSGTRSDFMSNLTPPVSNYLSCMTQESMAQWVVIDDKFHCIQVSVRSLTGIEGWGVYCHIYVTEYIKVPCGLSDNRPNSRFLRQGGSKSQTVIRMQYFLPAGHESQG